MMPSSRMPAYVPQQQQQGIRRKLDATMPAGETTADMVPRADNNPMDVGTVRKKLDNYEYRTALDFADDIRLIFSNCFKYKQQSQATSHCWRRT
ncbi:tyrosine-protein kinase BAZ1B-like [Drosophila nasuta]|uniref:tyrosine-protein kinase BAZ1B-like n=1 Tax=Drosophila nasuta TaxID=42062 RepID=UPI00295EA8E3|nr:tyrosine-protein kinase BAZ1B-like [Drosophila nasuta]